MVTVASRPEQIVNQLIQSVENLLKPKFPTAKAFLIGSHAYKIMKGGLATMDIYLDLRKFLFLLYYFYLFNVNGFSLNFIFHFSLYFFRQ